MTGETATEGLRLLVDGQRAEAADWRRFIENRDADARAALFARFAETVRKSARREFFRLKGLGLDQTDCEQIAYEALIQSIERFDPERGVPFTAFVRPRVRGAIHTALSKATEARASYSARQRAERDRIASLKRQASAAETDDPMEALREIVVGMALGFMLEDNASGEAAQIPSDDPSAYDSAAWNQAINAMRTKLATLPERERRVIDYHYTQGLRFTDIASLLGVSRARISQIHSQALARLRKSMSKFR